MKATLGGYRHLVRKQENQANDSAAKLKEVLTLALPQAFDTYLEDHEVIAQPEEEQAVEEGASERPEVLLHQLGAALKALVLVADHKYDEQSKDSLWPVRMDRPINPDPGSLSDIWSLLGSKVAQENLDSDLSLVRVLNVIIHLGACCGWSLNEIAEHSLQPAS